MAPPQTVGYIADGFNEPETGGDDLLQPIRDLYLSIQENVAYVCLFYINEILEILEAVIPDTDDTMNYRIHESLYEFQQGIYVLYKDGSTGHALAAYSLISKFWHLMQEASVSSPVWRHHEDAYEKISDYVREIQTSLCYLLDDMPPMGINNFYQLEVFLAIQLFRVDLPDDPQNELAKELKGFAIMILRMADELDWDSGEILPKYFIDIMDTIEEDWSRCMSMAKDPENVQGVYAVKLRQHLRTVELKLTALSKQVEHGSFSDLLQVEMLARNNISQALMSSNEMLGHVLSSWKDIIKQRAISEGDQQKWNSVFNIMHTLFARLLETDDLISFVVLPDMYANPEPNPQRDRWLNGITKLNFPLLYETILYINETMENLLEHDRDNKHHWFMIRDCYVSISNYFDEISYSMGKKSPDDQFPVRRFNEDMESQSLALLDEITALITKAAHADELIQAARLIHHVYCRAFIFNKLFEVEWHENFEIVYELIKQVQQVDLPFGERQEKLLDIQSRINGLLKDLDPANKGKIGHAFAEWREGIEGYPAFNKLFNFSKTSC
ncbi:MAG: hypothetical protein ABII23_00805 [bacterium]